MELTRLEKEIIIMLHKKPKWFTDRLISLLEILTRYNERAEFEANMEWFRRRLFEIHEDE